MANDWSHSLNPEKALIFRIMHRDNLPWVLEHGLYCRSAPEKTERYQAEALIHHHLPVSALLGIGAYTDRVRADIESQALAVGLQLKVVTRPNWFFS
ncbi:DarT ssDNA thymidine ADP-ribosyltransferase family protein [Alkalilimnicola ehrlichii]|uniref:DarT ssDNA thymidine ADP-ribosyltransferase family protein n=1 Tax=Alkalilimnicola ehrlichii TaxID=351052 RepID=UPI003BA3AB69